MKKPIVNGYNFSKSGKVLCTSQLESPATPSVALAGDFSGVLDWHFCHSMQDFRKYMYKT